MAASDQTELLTERLLLRSFRADDAADIERLAGEREIAANTATELGYWIGKPYWGRGYASEAARAVLFLGGGRARMFRRFSAAAAVTMHEACAGCETGLGGLYP